MAVTNDHILLEYLLTDEHKVVRFMAHFALPITRLKLSFTERFSGVIQRGDTILRRKTLKRRWSTYHLASGQRFNFLFLVWFSSHSRDRKEALRRSTRSFEEQSTTSPVLN